jgi:hypothetical protein
MMHNYNKQKTKDNIKTATTKVKNEIQQWLKETA